MLPDTARGAVLSSLKRRKAPCYPIAYCLFPEPVKIFGQIKFVKFENYPLNDVGGEWSVAERGSHIV